MSNSKRTKAFNSTAKLPLRIPYLYLSRHGIYYYRLHTKGIDRRVSLGTRNLLQAMQHVLKITSELGRDMPKKREYVDCSIRLTKGDITLELTDVVTEEDRAFAEKYLSTFSQMSTETPGLTPDTHKGKRKASTGIKLSECFKQHEQSADFQSLKHKTKSEKSKAFADFITLIGDKPVSTVSKKDIALYRDMLLKENANKETASASKRFGAIRTAFAYAVDSGLLEENPVQIRLSNSKRTKAKVRPWDRFTPEQLQSIFSPNLYPVDLRLDRLKGAYFWCPLLLLLSGARPNEIAQLRKSDVFLNEPIPYISINDDGDDEDKSIKTEGSKRLIPIHPVILELGFAEYLKAVPNNASNQVFPNLKYDASNGYTRNITRRFKEDILTPLKLRSNDRLQLRSFRPTFIRAVTERGANDYILKSLVGHFEGSRVDLGSVHATHYNHSHTLEAVLKTVLLMPTDCLAPLIKSI